MFSQAKRLMFTGLAGLVVLSTLAGCGKDALPNQTNGDGSDGVQLVRRGPGGQTRFLARNVTYRLDPTITMQLEDLNADIILKDPTLPFVPANKTDYSIQIHQAHVSKGPVSLQNLMNEYVFNDPQAPIRNCKIQFKGDRIVMSGEMKKGVWVGFEMEGTLDATPDGMIRMTPKVVKSMGVRVDGLMNLIGLQMASLMKMEESKGLILQGNVILMDVSRLYPPPTMLGKVSAVSISNNRLHITFDDGKAQPWPQLPVSNTKSCLAMWGGDILIDACLNLNAHMEILDSTPNDPQIFALDRYREQLEAGFVTPTKDGSMIAYVPDITSFGNMGRFTPGQFPVPGIKQYPSDMPSEDTNNNDNSQSTSSRN